MNKVVAVRASAEHRRPGDTEPYEEALRAAGLEPVVVSAEDSLAPGAGAGKATARR